MSFQIKDFQIVLKHTQVLFTVILKPVDLFQMELSVWVGGWKGTSWAGS